eukprot:TRINITY_DN15543_c0_g1_i1.p2 TRINITY_DN15543_c0_g1~~TRINITY_DN15543_c0_g1_i1.p2  ORF type:complete len:117 (+),score=9.39 TRINITY_DN15543_c0_g1_i1:553-903(+)
MSRGGIKKEHQNMAPWVLIPPMALVFLSVFSEEIFDPPFIDDDGRKREPGRKGCWGCPCGVDFVDPFADDPVDPLTKEPCPVCGLSNSECPSHTFVNGDFTNAGEAKAYKYTHCLV